MKKVLCLLLLICLSAGIGHAAPSKPILKMMRTPVTSFDFFLFELEESCKCDKWFGNPEWKTDPCMTVLEYNIEENIIYLNFYIYDPSRSTIYMRGFVNSNARQKETILRAAIQRLAVVIGLIDRPEMQRPYGLIQVTPIRRGWYSPDFKENELKEEIAKRTVITIQTKHKGNLYHIERKTDGDIVYEVSPVRETQTERERRARE